MVIHKRAVRPTAREAYVPADLHGRIGISVPSALVPCGIDVVGLNAAAIQPLGNLGLPETDESRPQPVSGDVPSCGSGIPPALGEPSPSFEVRGADIWLVWHSYPPAPKVTMYPFVSRRLFGPTWLDDRKLQDYLYSA